MHETKYFFKRCSQINQSCLIFHYCDIIQSKNAFQRKTLTMIPIFCPTLKDEIKQKEKPEMHYINLADYLENSIVRCQQIQWMSMTNS